MNDKINFVLKYHNETKHLVHRSARSRGFLDWKNQPNPFRFFEGCERQALYDSIGTFLEYALSISAWKAIPGSKWALRINPSSGNLHPTEGHLILPSGIYHYSPYLHALEKRAAMPSELWEKVCTFFGGEGLLVGLSSIHWREAWKYGERAFRYCHHDVGHALGALAVSAQLLDWNLVTLDFFSTQEINTILGLSDTNQNREESESGDILCYVYPKRTLKLGEKFPDFSELNYFGKPNQLSPEHVNWEIINQTALACEQASSAISFKSVIDFKDFTITKEIIKQRRSAVGYDGETVITKIRFLNIIKPSLEVTATNVHLIFFIHRVVGIDPGLYILVRNNEDLETLKEKLDDTFLWQRVASGLELYCLKLGNFEAAAANISCGQAIAADGAFSLGMLANFEKTVWQDASAYPRLFWESGIIGQILYLSAEREQLRATGIGCFFDDEFHRFIGLKDNSFQSIYHFTIGKAVEDERLQTLAAYHHLL